MLENNEKKLDAQELDVQNATAGTGTAQGEGAPAPKKKKKKNDNLVSNILLAVGAGLILFTLVTGGGARTLRWFQGMFGGADQGVDGPTVTLEPLEYPVGELIVTELREAYEEDTMYLVVPRMGVKLFIKNGTTPEILSTGAGLYEYSTTPGYGNPNVSIAAHRGVHGAEFYNIDKLREGDQLYLYYDGYLYTYTWRETFIVGMYDWSKLAITEDSMLTLTSCDFDATNTRWVARSVLTNVQKAKIPTGADEQRPSDDSELPDIIVGEVDASNVLVLPGAGSSANSGADTSGDASSDGDAA